MKKLITVYGMTCENCRKEITTGLEEINGINRVSVKLPERLVEVDFKDDIISLKEIKKHIQDLNYDPI
jgi:copper chaperone CopZ